LILIPDLLKPIHGDEQDSTHQFALKIEAEVYVAFFVYSARNADSLQKALTMV
jgi:hypothetical protein